MFIRNRKKDCEVIKIKDNWKCRRFDWCRAESCAENCSLMPCRICGLDKQPYPNRLICRACYLAMLKDYRQSADDDYAAEYARQYYRVNIEKRREYHKLYQRNRRKKIKEQKKSG